MSIYSAGNSSVNGGDLTQTEIPIYGSSRLGEYKPNIDVQNTGSSTNPTTTVTLPDGTTVVVHSSFTRGLKSYELSNHLGNVLVTVSDEKAAVDLNHDGVIDYYTAIVISAQDYYPFGMLEPGRQYAATTGSGYRYGFNGKEQDNDIDGTGVDYDYGFRIYDARIGKFLSVDPLQKKYPELTPYQFASNSPLAGVDQDGLEFSFITDWFADKAKAAGYPRLSGFVRSFGAGDVNRVMDDITIDAAKGNIKQAATRALREVLSFTAPVMMNGIGQTTISAVKGNKEAQGQLAGMGVMVLVGGITGQGEGLSENAPVAPWDQPLIPEDLVSKQAVVANNGNTNAAVVNRGTGIDLENVSNRNPAAQSYEDKVNGAASDVASKKRLVPTLKYDNPNINGKNYVKFDGFDVEKNELIDRKWNVTTFPKQLNQLSRMSEALKQNPSYKGIIEVPTQQAYNNAVNALNKANVNNITVRIAPN